MQRRRQTTRKKMQKACHQQFVTSPLKSGRRDSNPRHPAWEATTTCALSLGNPCISKTSVIVAVHADTVNYHQLPELPGTNRDNPAPHRPVPGLGPEVAGMGARGSGRVGALFWPVDI